MSLQEDFPLNEQVTSIILAGGQGTRLHPLTLHRSKPAVSFGGKYRLIDVPISNCLNSQIHRIFVICQHFASGLQQHLMAAYPHSRFRSGNLSTLCPEQTENGMRWFKGTADAVRQNLPTLLSSPGEYFLILSGDQLYNINLIEMIRFAQEKKADLVIASLTVQEREAKRMGLLKINPDHQIIDFFEKPNTPELLKPFEFKAKDKSCYLGSMGIYVFKKTALIEVLEKSGDDFGKDLIPFMVKKNKAFSFIYEGYWEDIGTVSSFYEANLALISQKNCLDVEDRWRPIYTEELDLPNAIIKNAKIDRSIISPGCLIEAKEVIHSLIGIRTQIGEGSKIHDSIIIGNQGSFCKTASLTIGKNCTIQKAIIDEEAQIGNEVQLINKKNLTHYDGDGIFIREGIIIVTSGTKIPDQFIL
jgi:glucose-1-phosphate adenylyltransferase